MDSVGKIVDNVSQKQKQVWVRNIWGLTASVCYRSYFGDCMNTNIAAAEALAHQL